MPDIIITPSTGKIEFIHQGGQAPRVESIILHQEDGLVFSGKISASSVTAPLNVINVTAGSSNVNYPFIFASSGETGAKSLLMDSAGGTYNPSTNTATIDVSGNSATTTLASNSSQLNGQAASYYTDINARLGYTPVNKAGDTVTGNLIINGNFSVNGSFTAFSASNVYISSSQLYIEDNILTLNAFSPYLRYAGVEMYDSGSGTLSSLLWDGEADYFFLTGSSVNGKIITGPDGQTNLTANFVAKATAGNKLGNSIIYDNGTSVGIGTTTVNQKVSIYPGTTGGISLQDIDSETRSYFFIDNTNGIFSTGIRTANYYLDFDSSGGAQNAIRFYTGTSTIGTGTERMRIISTGNVGIGTNTPGARLEISSSTAASLLNVKGAGGNGILYVSGSGAVGIGTTSISDGARLTIAGETRIASSAAYFTHLNYLDGGNNIISSANGGSTVFRGSSNNITAMTILGSGNVGIGTSSPGGKFEIRTDASSNYIFSGSSTSGYTTTFTMDDTASYFGHDSSVRSLILRTNSTARLTVKGDGNVGIGTTSPTSKLHVVETTATGSRIQLGSSSTNALMNTNLVNDFLILTAPFSAVPASVSNNNAKWGIKMGGGSIDSPNALEKSACIYAVSEEDIGAGGSGAGYNRKVGLALHTSPFDLPNVERVRINNLGNVGIGTSSPTQRLHVLTTGGSTTTPNIVATFQANTATTILAGGGTAIKFVGVSSGGNLQDYDQCMISSLGYVGNNQHGMQFWVKPNASTVLTVALTIDNNSAIVANSSVTAASFSGAGTGLTGTAASLSIGGTAATATTASYSLNTTLTTAATYPITSSWATNAVTALNGGVTSVSAGTGIGTSASTGAVTITNSSPNATHTGDVTGATALTIANDAVTTVKILNANVTNAKLANSSVTIGSTAVSLGGTVTTFAGLASVTSTAFVGALTGNVTGNVTGTAGSETFATVTGRGASTTTQISVGTTAGGSMYTGIKSGAGYSDAVSGATFKSITDHPTGGSYAFAAYFNGAPGTGTNSFFVAADGTGYFKGYVGIGTTAPQYPLDISGSNIRSFSTAGGAEPGFIADYPSSNGYGGFFIHVNNTRRWRIGSVGDTNVQPALNFWQEGTGSRMIITNTGNVGIGTTSPGYKLDVNGPIGISGFRFVDQSTHYFRIFEPAGNIALYLGNATDPANYYDNTSHTFRNRGGSSNYVTINSSGNVGIGTTSPASRLHVVGSEAYIRVTDSDDSGVFFIGNASGFGYIRAFSRDFRFLNAAGTSLINIASGGNIGIGTTGPSARLHVFDSNESPATGNLLVTSTGGNASIRIDSQNTSKYTYFTLSQGGVGKFELGITPTSSDLYINHNVQSGANGAAIYIKKADGNVGIGTTAPGAPLTIYKASNPWIRVNGGGAFSYIQLDDGASYGYLFKNTSSDTSNGALAGAMYTYTDSGKAFQHIHSGTPLFTILSGGNVGIGSTSPGYKLDVVGDINFSSTLKFGGINVISNASGDVYLNGRVIRNESNSSQDGMYIGYNSTGTTNAHIRFYANAGNERMRIQANDGNVGIGTTSAGKKLDVEGVVRTRGASGTGGFEIGAATTGTAKWRIEWDSASDSLDFNWVG